MKILLIIVSLISFTVNIIFADTIKEPAVAGAFYPASPKELSQQIQEFLDKAQPQEVEGKIVGLISPHAGYIYSGGVAAYGYKLLKGEHFDTVVIIGPSHYVDFSGISVWAKGVFNTPLGNIAIDEELAGELIKSNPEEIRFYSASFAKEHSIEVQIPFLQSVLTNFRIVPVLIAKPSLENAKILAEALHKTVKDKNILIITSTDMSHYHTYKEAVSIDNLTLKYLRDLDVEGLYNSSAKGQSELCGLGGVLALLFFAKEDNLKLKVLKYANSGDVTFDLNRVVGYTSCVLFKTTDEHRFVNTDDHRDNKKGEEMLKDTQKNRLLEIARKSLEDYVVFGKRNSFSENDPALIKECGAFVTLTIKGELRGCIGHIVVDTPLYKTIADMAIEAGTGDPRFSPLTAGELKDIQIEISVLSPLERITDVEKIEVGKHGILLRRGFYSGLLLPQVATEYGWDRNTFLEHTCYKAGLPGDAWKDKSTQIYIFSALVFSEKELNK